MAPEADFGIDSPCRIGFFAIAIHECYIFALRYILALLFFSISQRKPASHYIKINGHNAGRPHKVQPRPLSHMWLCRHHLETYVTLGASIL